MLNTTYKYNNLEEAKVLAPVMDQKLTMLQKFVEEGSSVLSEVEFEKVAPGKNGAIFRVEANITIDGKLHRAEATEESFEKAMDEVKNELDKELRRAKGKETSMMRRAARRIKERFLGGQGM